MSASTMNEKLAQDSDYEYYMSKGKYIEAPLSILKSYFEGHHLERLVRHQIESYNLFRNHQIEQTIGMFNPVHIVSDQDYKYAESGKTSLEIDITFENFNIYRPQIQENNGATKLMFPQAADGATLTYLNNGCRYSRQTFG